MTDVLIRGKDARRHKGEGYEKTEAETGVTHTASQGMPRIAISHQMLGRDKEGSSPIEFRRNTALPIS